MTLSTSFASLRRELRALEESLDALSTTIDEDKPARGDVTLVGQLSDAVIAVRGMLHEALAAADQAYQAVILPPNADHALHGLIACQAAFHRAADHASDELLAYERIHDLAQFGAERGAECCEWASIVRDALDQARVSVRRIRDALFLCWQDLTESRDHLGLFYQNTSDAPDLSIHPGSPVKFVTAVRRADERE